jgi:hypothetical protein
MRTVWKLVKEAHLEWLPISMLPSKIDDWTEEGYCMKGMSRRRRRRRGNLQDPPGVKAFELRTEF